MGVGRPLQPLCENEEKAVSSDRAVVFSFFGVAYFVTERGRSLLTPSYLNEEGVSDRKRIGLESAK